MVWALTSLFFCWLIFREIRNSMVPRQGYSQPEPIYKPYLFSCFILAISFAWPPLHYWRFERFLSAKATELADMTPAKVHCNTAIDAIFDREPTFSHANPTNGEIIIQPPWCARLMDYLDHPDRANRLELHSLNSRP